MLQLSCEPDAETCRRKDSLGLKKKVRLLQTTGEVKIVERMYLRKKKLFQVDVPIERKNSHRVMLSVGKLLVDRKGMLVSVQQAEIVVKGKS